jgi:5-methylcytosine-specific restriction endonuclease McrA
MSKRRNERVSNGWRRRQLRARVLAAYDVCAICGKPVDKTLKTPHPMSAEVDELVPVSRGGDPYSFANCRLTHRRCNRFKSDKTDEHARALLAGRQDVKSSSMPFKTFGI